MGKKKENKRKKIKESIKYAIVFLIGILSMFGYITATQKEIIEKEVPKIIDSGENIYEVFENKTA